MSLDLLYERGDEIDGIFFDVTRTANHELSSTPTRRAVGAGSPFSDHVQQNPDVLSGEVAISNYPLFAPPGFESRTLSEQLGPFTTSTMKEGAKANASGVTPATFEERSATQNVSVTRIGPGGALAQCSDIFAELARLKEQVIDLTITTSIRIYERMILTRISVNETPEANGADGMIIVSLGFDKIRIARSEVVESPVPLETRAERNRRRGRVAAEEQGEDEGPQDSLLSQWLGGGSTVEGGS